MKAIREWFRRLAALPAPSTPNVEGMKQGLTAQSILFASVLKWFILATGAGAAVGLAATVFLKVLAWSIQAVQGVPLHFILMPAAFAASAALTHYLVPEARGHGTEKVIEAVHKRSGRIDPLVVPVKLLATVITIAAGGSAGKEGPCAQIGAGVTSTLAGWLRFSDADRKKLVICGISAGFASVFGTPIAGAIFGVEVLVVGNLMYDVLLPSFIAGMVSFQVSSALGIRYFYHPVAFAPQLSESVLLTVLVAAVFFGLVSVLLVRSLALAGRLSGRLALWPPLHGALGGLMLLGLALLCTPQYLGLGVETIEGALSGTPVAWSAFLLKILFTSITLAFWGSGGVVTPIFFVGTTAGCAFAALFGLHPPTYAVIGMVALLAGAANTPIAASIMAVELFGPAIAPYTTIACVVSFLISGYHSVYPSQVLGMIISDSLPAPVGREMRDVEPEIRPTLKRWPWHRPTKGAGGGGPEEKQ